VVPSSLRCPAGWVTVKVGPFTLRTNGVAWTAHETQTGRAVMLDAVRCQYAGGKRSRARLHIRSALERIARQKASRSARQARW
jgi:hypothetical protein